MDVAAFRWPDVTPVDPALEGFDRWWAVYPRKVAKAEAKAVWLRRWKVRRIDVEAALVKLQHDIQHEWNDRPADKIPHARTYLHQQRDLDVIDQPVQAGGFVSWRQGCTHDPECGSLILHQLAVEVGATCPHQPPCVSYGQCHAR